MSMIFLLNSYDISMRLLWYLKRILWYSYDISMGFLWKFYGISMRFLWKFYGGSMIFLWDFYDYWIPAGFP